MLPAFLTSLIGGGGAGSPAGMIDSALKSSSATADSKSDTSTGSKTFAPVTFGNMPGVAPSISPTILLAGAGVLLIILLAKK